LKYSIQAKEKAIKIIDEAKKEENVIRNELKQIQARVESREALYDKKLLDFEDEKTKLQQEKEQAKQLKEKLNKIIDDVVNDREINIRFK
jgi:hypothetical protein